MRQASFESSVRAHCELIRFMGFVEFVGFIGFIEFVGFVELLHIPVRDIFV